MTEPPVRPESLVNRSLMVLDNLDSKDGIMINGGRSVKSMVTENPVLILGKRGCCMAHVMKRLLQAIGVNPAVYEVDGEDELAVLRSGEGKEDGREQVMPLLYIDGKLFGGLERLMAAHISGELIPVLKKAGALWL